MANDPRIGTISETDGIQYPTQSISGRPIADRNGMASHGIGGGRFVLFDMAFAPGFDLDAALTELKQPATPPTAAAKPASKPPVTTPE